MCFLQFAAAAAKSLQSCPTLCDSVRLYAIDGSPPGSSVPGILQARRLEWVAISFSVLQFSPRQLMYAYIKPMMIASWLWKWSLSL